jgi:predicted acetyltransferase
MPRSVPELVNPVPAEETPAWVRAMITTFLEDPNSPRAAQQADVLTRIWDPARAWGVRDRGRWVATLRTEERSLSVPGVDDETNDVRVDALTNVTVAATHRRQGLMSRMLGGSLAAARARGDAISVLIAAEWPIYGRFGYAPATLSANYAFHRSRPGANCSGDPTRVRQVEREEVGDVAPAVYSAARRQHAGQIDRDRGWWDRALGREGYPLPDKLPYNWFVHEGDDGPDGLLSWKATGVGFDLIPPLATIEVRHLASTSDTAYRNLWAYLSGIDSTDQISLANRSVDEPARWLLRDARTLVMTQHVDFLWLRLLDVPSALAARRYAASDDVVLEVIDDDAGGSASGRYRLSARGDEVECRRTDQDADLEITQRALASIYLGGFRLRELLPSGVAREHRPGALARLDLMFSTPLAPWNATWF